MRIAVISTQNNGKTTLVEAFKRIWDNHVSPTKTYRELIKEKGLDINESGTVESQRIIRDSLIDTALDYAKEPYSIHDRCIIDNLVYTLWLQENGKINDPDFVADSINIARETIKFFDIIFWLPLNKNILLQEKENRSIDPVFRKQIDDIFAEVYASFQSSENILFDIENSPPIIKLEGNLNQKIDTIRQYINSNGDLIETGKSVLEELQGEMSSDFEQQNFIQQVREGK